MAQLSVHRSVVQADALAAALQPHYPFGEIKDCFLYVRGISDTYKLEAEAGDFFVRLSTTGAQLKALQDEARLLDYLANRQFPSCKAYARHDGSYISIVDAPEGQRAALLSHAIATQPLEQNSAMAIRLAQALAEMHQLVDMMPAKLQRPFHDYHYFIENTKSAINSFRPISQRYNWQAELWNPLEKIWQAISTIKQEPPYFGLCHGDFMFGNCLLSSDNQITIIDYDYCGYGWRLYDLATLIWLEIDNIFQPEWNKSEMLCGFVAAYHAIRPLAPAEYQLLAYFVALRQVFIFGARIRNSAAFGFHWYETNHINEGLDIIRLCSSDEWYKKTGLPIKL